MVDKPRILKIFTKTITLFILSVFVLVACVQPSAKESESPGDSEAQSGKVVADQENPTNSPEPSPTPQIPTETPLPPPPTTTPLPETTKTPEVQLSGLSADPQRVEFKAADGKSLVGYYFPSKYAQAPVIVLMHWAGGNQRDWCVIAPWLQNRLDESPVEMPGCADAPATFQWGGPTYWWDPTWFPPMPMDASFATFTFDFRDFGESETGMGSRSELAQDALSAFMTVSNLEGVDNNAMVSMGASIGSDGAADGCSLYNQDAGGGCLGAYSLSPGNYLDMPFVDVVNDLDTSDPSVPVWCLAAENDDPSYMTCTGASGEHYRSQLYMGREEHGMKLVDPNFDPNPLDFFLEFLALFFDI